MTEEIDGKLIVDENTEEVRGEDLREYFNERRIRRVLPYFVPESIPAVQMEPTFYRRFCGVLMGATKGMD